MSMSLRENITAVIETCFSETKDEIQDTAINRILELIRTDRKTESYLEIPNNCEPNICDTCRYYNSNIPCGSTPSACKKADKFAEEFVDELKKLKPDDLIRRSDAINAMKELSEHYTDEGREWHPHIDFVLNELRKVPTVEPKQGEWTNAGVLTVQCSNCKSQFHELEAMNFCPNCGAVM